jgi:hypothetical protein
MRECAELGIRHVWMHRGPAPAVSPRRQPRTGASVVRLSSSARLFVSRARGYQILHNRAAVTVSGQRLAYAGSRWQRFVAKPNHFRALGGPNVCDRVRPLCSITVPSH